MSLDLLIGYTGLVSFGHAAFFGLAAYSLHLVSPEYDAANLLWALPACIAIAAAAAAVIGALTVRTKNIYFIMVTLAFAQMLFFLFHDTKIAGGSDGAYIFVKPTLSLFGLTLVNFEDRIVFFYVCLLLVIACYFALLTLLRSPFGQVIMGIKVNEHRMRALGYNTYVYKLVSFIIAGSFAGLAGFLFACIDGFVSPELLSWRESGIAIMVVILGGMGTLFGPVIGAVAFVGAEEVFKDRHIVFFMSEHWQILMGAFVIAVALLLPNGLASLLLRATGGAPRKKQEADDE
jgi:branched-chain amino acid transport system permease protein